MNQESLLTFKEILHLVQFLLGVVILLSLSEIIRRRYYLSGEFNRKFVHLGVGAFIFFAPMIFARKNPVLVISAFFILINFIAYRLGWLQSVHPTSRKSYGTVYYPLSLFILTLLLWDTSPGIVVASMMVMVVGDSAAGITGESLKHPHEYVLSSDKKSLEGSLMMFIFSVIAIGMTTWYYHVHRVDVLFQSQHTIGILIFTWIAIALFATTLEAISSRGLDNLTVPLAAAFALYFCFHPFSGGDVYRFILAIILAGLVSSIAFSFKFLKPSGSVATFILATIIFSIGGWMWTIPILTFFILSSLLSTFNKSKKSFADSITVKGDVRDYVQVIANGCVPAFIIFIYFFDPDFKWFIIYLSAIASVTADTWSSEIGILSKKNPRNILTFKSEPHGTSGAVTLLGTLGGIIGAGVIASFVFLLPQSASNFQNHPIIIIVIIILSGVVGNFIDSVLGASVQAKYACEICGKMTEKIQHCDSPARFMRGIRWINNDTVNFLCGLSGAVIALILYSLLIK